MENDALRDMLKGHARAAGLPADAAGKFLSEVAASIRADEEAAFKEADEALKDEWGAEYETNVSAAKAFARKLSVESGVSMEKMAVFASPDGFRVLHAISRLTGEGGLKGGGQIPAKTDPADEAQAILSDPNHRYYKAIADPSHPQWWGFPVSFFCVDYWFGGVSCCAGHPFFFLFVQVTVVFIRPGDVA